MYDKHEIMINAWNTRHDANISMSITFRAAWASVEATKATEVVAENTTWNIEIHVDDWAKGGHNRTCVEVVAYTNTWNRKCTERIGYVNNMTGSFMTA